MSETEIRDGSLEIHVDPQNERELESLLDTVTALMSQHVRESRPSSGAVPSLVWPPEISEREAEVLQLVADGGTAGSVALALHLSIHTVRSHIRNARRKLKSTTISQAVGSRSCSATSRRNRRRRPRRSSTAMPRSSCSSRRLVSASAPGRRFAPSCEADHQDWRRAGAGSAGMRDA